jgi:excisionase family DNA binding protein
MSERLVDAADRIAYSPAELADLVGLSRKAIYRAIERGELRASRVANRLRIRPIDVDAWLEGGLVEPSARVSPCVSLPMPRRARTTSLRAVLEGAGSGANSSPSGLLPS